MKWFRRSQRLYWVCHCVVWFVIKQTPQTTSGGARLRVRLLAGRASIFLSFAARSTIIYVGKDQGSCEWRHRTRRLGNMSGWRTSFRRTIFVVHTKILYCGPTITHKVSFWRLKWSQLLRKFASQNKAKNAGRSRKNARMREIHQNAGFRAQLRDGWHLWWYHDWLLGCNHAEADTRICLHAKAIY